MSSLIRTKSCSCWWLNVGPIMEWAKVRVRSLLSKTLILCNCHIMHLPTISASYLFSNFHINNKRKRRICLHSTCAQSNKLSCHYFFIFFCLVSLNALNSLHKLHDMEVIGILWNLRRLEWWVCVGIPLFVICEINEHKSRLCLS